MLYTILKYKFYFTFLCYIFIFTIIFGSSLFIEFMMEKKQLRAIFLYEFKLAYIKHKAAEATCNVNNDELKVLVVADPRITICELALKLDVNHPTVLDHLRQLRK